MSIINVFNNKELFVYKQSEKIYFTGKSPVQYRNRECEKHADRRKNQTAQDQKSADT